MGPQSPDQLIAVQCIPVDAQCQLDGPGRAARRDELAPNLRVPGRAPRRDELTTRQLGTDQALWKPRNSLSFENHPLQDVGHVRLVTGQQIESRSGPAPP